MIELDAVTRGGRVAALTPVVSNKANARVQNCCQATGLHGDGLGPTARFRPPERREKWSKKRVSNFECD
jgi:hypothetical protein